MDEARSHSSWLRQWAPTFAVLVPLLTATYYLGSELAHMDQGQAELKMGFARLETRMGAMETRMDAMESRMDTLTVRVETLVDEIRAELRENRVVASRLQDNVANVRERVSAIEARQG